jgi:hypothetical protein
MMLAAIEAAMMAEAGLAEHVAVVLGGNITDAQILAAAESLGAWVREYGSVADTDHRVCVVSL